MGYVNGDWDLMLEKAPRETDPEKRTLLYAEIQVFLNPELPVGALINPIFMWVPTGF